jgi:hypothetical protein
MKSSLKLTNTLKPRVKVLLSPVLPEVRMSIALLGGTQALSALTDKCTVKISFGTKYWWNDTDRRKVKYSERIPFQYHFFHRKSHMDQAGIDLQSLR